MTPPVCGVRAVERAGALLAAADDADSLWRDPGCCSTSRTSLRASTTPGSIGEKSPRLDVEPAIGFTVPTVAATLGIGDRRVLAGGIAAPYAGLHRHVDDDPQRYASVSLAGSAFLHVITLGAAYRVTDRLRIGATVSDGAGHPD